MNKSFCIFSRHLVLLVIAALAGSTLCAPTIDSGDWLAQELDMQGPEKFQEALALKNLKEPEALVDQVDAATAQDYEQLAKLGRFEEALALIDLQILKQANQDDGETAIIKLAEDRLRIQEQLDRSVEALMEKYNLKLPSAKH